MKKYLRFGKIPTTGKSVNFMSMKIDDVKYFTWCCENYDYESAISLVDKKHFENGISVFELDENENPILSNEDLKNSYNVRVERNVEKYYILGNEVGRGYDGEPLVEFLEFAN